MVYVSFFRGKIVNFFEVLHPRLNIHLAAFVPSSELSKLLLLVDCSSQGWCHSGITEADGARLYPVHF